MSKMLVVQREDKDGKLENYSKKIKTWCNFFCSRDVLKPDK